MNDVNNHCLPLQERKDCAETSVKEPTTAVGSIARAKKLECRAFARKFSSCVSNAVKESSGDVQLCDVCEQQLCDVCEQQQWYYNRTDKSST